MHARIRYVEGSWWITNLSETNPLSLNGRELRGTEEVALTDGDRVQLGEVELIYRQRRP
jgi:predicted component of type VI protein secretion system